MNRLLPILCLLLLTCSEREAPGPIILISIDTLRADRVNARQTPHLHALAQDAISYTQAFTHVPLTLPAHVSILTGKLPHEHGVRNNIGFRFDGQTSTLPQVLKQRGYATGAAVSAYVLRAESGLATAFDFYESNVHAREGETIGRVQRPGEETAAIAQRWISGQGERPFFFMLHLFEPHTPYESGSYDGDVARADAIVGDFIAFLKKSGIYDRATIVLLSDHGEGLGDHGEEEHGIFLYREAIQVPLMIKLPQSERAGERIAEPVQLADLYPTLTGEPGQSLLAEVPKSRRIYSESLYPRIHLGWSELRSLVDGEFHYIDAPRAELYTAADAAEKTNVLDENRRVAASMRKDLEPFPRDIPKVTSIDPEEAQKLAALGYLSSTTSNDGPLPDPKDGIAQLARMKEAASMDDVRAIEAYRAIVAESPRFTDAWTLLARALERRGRWEESTQAYRRAIELSPAMAPELSLSLANLYLLMNRPEDAIRHAELGAAANRGNAHLMTGRAGLAKNDLAMAEREARAAMETSARVPALVLLAQVRVKQRNLDEASALIDEAQREIQAKRLDVPPLLFYVRGDILARRNQMPAAVAAFEEEIARFPHDRQAYANLTAIHLLTGRRAEAHATMERLVKANPSPSSYELAARTFEELGDAEGARRWRR